MAERPDRTGDLDQIAIPTLVFTGENDAISPPDEAIEIAQRLPNSFLGIVQGAGHMAPIEKEDETNDVVLHFLKTLGDG